jgi:DNA invertase Pin-like site-specific DNA recombinase
MNAAEAADHVRKLRALLARGDSIRQAAKAAGLSKSTAQRLAAKSRIPRRRAARRLTDAEKRQIRRDAAKVRATLRRVARLARVGVATVHRTLNPVEPGAPRRVRPYTCPAGHRVFLRPCQVCQALQAARSAAVLPAFSAEVGHGTAVGRS